MKTTNRASRKAGKKSTSAQSATAPKTSPGKTLTEIKPAQTLTPSVEAIRLADAIALYRSSLDASGSLALLHAANIQWGMKVFAGWETFELHPRFLDGIYEVIRAALSHAVKMADNMEAIYSPMLKKLLSHTAPVLCVEVDFETRNEALAKRGYDYKTDKFGDLEDGFMAMKELLEMLGVILSERAPGKVGYFIAQVMKDALEESYAALREARRTVLQVIVSIECGLEPHAAIEQKEAA